MTRRSRSALIAGASVLFLAPFGFAAVMELLRAEPVAGNSAEVAEAQPSAEVALDTATTELPAATAPGSDSSIEESPIDELGRREAEAGAAHEIFAGPSEREWSEAYSPEHDELAFAAPGEFREAEDEIPVTNAAAGMATLVATGLSAPIYATGALRGDPSDPTPAFARDPRLFIVERSGVIKILDEGSVRPTEFLDIRGRVGTAGEGGLLGLAFAPDHPESGIFYVYYTNRSGFGNSVLSRFEVGSDPNVADDTSEEVLLTVVQPASNHQGGTIQFSPVDGFLYWASGDGGSSNDPSDNAQAPDTLLGKMLRIDVSGGPGSGYTVPGSNPWAGAADPTDQVLDEIWAFGLRNPFRWSFDTMTGDIWIGDVGQGLREEIDFEAAGDGGQNYGWDDREGDIANPNGSSTPAFGLPVTDPIISYAHQNGGCGGGGSGTVTGGAVYRGPTAAIQGEYFYADYCTGEIWSYEPVGDNFTDQSGDLGTANDITSIVAIGEGGFGGLYLVRIDAGTVHRVGDAGSECSDGVDNDGDGEMDGADSGCSGGGDSSELDMDTPCDDGYDNDFDGNIDFPADNDCASSADNGEMPAGGGGGGGGGGAVGGSSGGGCGFGFELILLWPLLRARQRRAA